MHASSIAMPILPYVPPNSAQIMDLISNAFGVTAPAIEDAAEKFQAYLKLYQTILGASYDSFKTELDGIIDDAKTSGVITINQNASSIMQNALSYALEHGYEAGESLPAIDNVQGAISRTQALGISNSSQAWNDIYNTANSYFNNYYKQDGYRYCVAYAPNNIAFIVIPAVFWRDMVEGSFSSYIDNVGRRWFNYKRASDNTTRTFNYIYITFWTLTNGNVGTKTGSTTGSVITESWAGNTQFADFGIDATSYTQVQAQSQSITNSLSTGAVVPVTAETDINDMTGDVKIRIPAVTIYPAQTVEDLPGVQDDLGVMPTTADTTQAQLEDIIEQLQELQATKYGDVSKYSINLTEYFPFCIPFDIGNILTMFVAEPEAPVVTFPLPVGYGEDGIIMQEFTLDLSQFDTVALWCRRGMLLVFIVGLAMVTRKVFLRG